VTAEPERAPAGEGAAHDTDRERARRAQALLYVQKLAKAYTVPRGLFGGSDLVHALNGVTFYVRRQETLGLVGESGSGKSTLGRVLLRLVEPTVGRIAFDGIDVTALGAGALRSLRRRMQIVFQDPYASLNPNMTVLELVREGIDIFRLGPHKRERDALAEQMMARVGLDARLGRRHPHALSGGQRQRVAIARALAVRPDFVVLDEPLSALDLSVQAQILNLLEDLQEQLGLTLLFISHDLRAVQHLCHRIGVLHFGKIVEIGPSIAVMRRRYHPYTRALFDAMPRAEPGALRRLRLPVLDEVGAPSPLRPPRGCAFFGRCDNAEAGTCDVREPPLAEIEPRSHHRVACFHPHQDEP
jgi:oligopeptide transport system ATP-binding protein